ncbi:hypothetical protein BpHYR1_038189 [Brachionus plicatilis]|uniref:Uncharacterized protein n=1 Tax=Brachionus plicatilis TaxID=10195 RepID=A0A3M7S5E0_BRAPC|nr:hypothetical protein BpHYR1_038189 [Brachionus plicatilis]
MLARNNCMQRNIGKNFSILSIKQTKITINGNGILQVTELKSNLELVFYTLAEQFRKKYPLFEFFSINRSKNGNSNNDSSCPTSTTFFFKY